MYSIEGVGLSDVQAVYDGAEGELWELVMGEQIHIGGMNSSMALAERAGIGEGKEGVDLCCCNGAGMRFLVRFRGVAKMTGVDATGTVVERGKQRCEEEGLADKISFVLNDVCASGLPDGYCDFVWGEDAWCYVVDKAKLVTEAARILRSGGTIAFTDWVAGPVAMSNEEAERYLRFMKFPNVLDVDDYTERLQKAGFSVTVAEDTGRFPAAVDLYLNMLGNQLTYDALKKIGFNMEIMQGLGGEMGFVQQLAHENKIMQGIFVGTKS